MTLSALTCTGARPVAFALCERYMAAQSLQPNEWIVVDDCDPPTRCTMGQTIIRPEPRWPYVAVENTQYRNMAAGLRACSGDLVVIFEDDDWYSNEYISRASNYLEKTEVAGENPCRYYNVQYRAWREFGRTPHASLASTSLRRSAVPDLLEVCLQERWLDLNFWARVSTRGRIFEQSSVIGIKGLPGRPGVTQVHREIDRNWFMDPDLEKLREWIGPAADNYARYCSGIQSGKKPMEHTVRYKTVTTKFGTRYACQEEQVGGFPCAFDTYSLEEFEKHFTNSHALTQHMGQTLFDSQNKPVVKKIILDGTPK